MKRFRLEYLNVKDYSSTILFKILFETFYSFLHFLVLLYGRIGKLLQSALSEVIIIAISVTLLKICCIFQEHNKNYLSRLSIELTSFCSHI